jgi:hypothetical protein
MDIDLGHLAGHDNRYTMKSFPHPVTTMASHNVERWF